MSHRMFETLIVAALVAGTTPAAANDFDHAWSCQLLPGQSLADARAVSAAWLQAARSMRGGEQLGVHIRYPIVVGEGADRFEFVVRAPSLEAWGAFYDGYDPDSPVGKADEAFAAVASCSGSSVWEIIPVDR